jgi:hypothetical protein
MIPVKVCRGECGQALPATPEFFGVHNKYGRLHLRSRCRECAKVAQRVYSRRHAERNRTDPSRAVMVESRRQRMRQQSRERYHADIEESRRKLREKRRRQRKDSARRKAERERERIDYRLQREREGVPLEAVKAQTDRLRNSLEDQGTTAAPFERLPAWPLAAAIMAEDSKRLREHYAGCLADFKAEGADISKSHVRVEGWSENAERNVRSWACGERLDVQFDVVDRVLSSLGWCWWEVYNPVTVRRHSLVISYRQPITSQGKVPTERVIPKDATCRFALDRDGIYGTDLPPRKAKYVTPRRRRVGDEGPNMELLERVRHTFECTGYPSCHTCRAQREGEQTQMVLGEVA